MKLLVKQLCLAFHYLFSVRFTHFPLYSLSLMSNIRFHIGTKQQIESPFVYLNPHIFVANKKTKNTELYGSKYSLAESAFNFFMNVISIG
jgi:hypothetical protein